MILDPKIKIIEVSLQGILHAIVPTHKNDASARLNRALRQIERDYGLKLTFTPNKPKADPGYPEHHNCKCHTKPVGDDLPKCTASDRAKEIYLEDFKKYPDVGHNADAKLWLDVTKDDSNTNSNPNSRRFNLHCPFCADQIYFHPLENNGDQLNRFKRYLQNDSPIKCSNCQISFQWDFDKNTVIMKNERSE